MKIAVFIFGDNSNITWDFITTLNCDVYTSINNTNLIKCWKDCLNQINGKDYDIIILSDSNNSITTSTDYTNFLNYTKDCALYSTRSIYHIGLNDFWIDEDFLMGNFNVMSSFINLLPNNVNNVSELGRTIVELGYYVDVVRDIQIKTRKI
jgi:hypothetical protein